MGNFEKLGILVIIVLVVVIIVVAAVGMDDPPPSKRSLAAATPVGGGDDPVPPESDDPPADRPGPDTPPIGGGGGDRPRVDPPVPVDPPAPVPPVTPEPRKYTVKSGDRLWTIAEKMYGAGKGIHWRKIAKANPAVDPDNLKIGVVLIIPDLAAARAPAPRNEVAEGARTYRIKDDDRLWTIARKLLGKGSRWPEIVAMNPALDPDVLKAGTEILIPAR